LKSSSRNRSPSRGGGSRASLISRLTTWFDAYTELYTVDPVKIERALKNYEGTDLEQVWKSIRKDVERINELPEKSDKIMTYVKRSSYARTISFILTAVTFVFLLIFFEFTNQLKAFGGSSASIIALGAVIAVMYVALMYNTFATRKLNKAMREFYDEHAQELKKQTAHIREAAQLMIDKLQREIYAQDLNPDKYKFELYNENYKNIRIVGRRRERAIATVKLRSKGTSD
jgi:uncharacterized membrane protein (DUF485 family)